MGSFDQLVLRGDPGGIRRARRFARTRVGPASADADTVELVVAELVTNAVLHGAPPIVIRIRMLDTCIHIDVADLGGRLPVMRRAARDGITGRGLRIVNALSAGWGVRRLARGGKVVWAEVAPGTTDPAPIPLGT